MYKLLSLLRFFLFFTFAIYATPIQYAPIMMEGITTFVPYSHVKLSLGSDKIISEGSKQILTANVSHPEDVSRYEWREGNQLLSTELSFSTEGLSIGTHIITFTIIDINGLSVSDNIIITVGSSEYEGKRSEAILNDSNYLKFVRAKNYLENLNWQDLLYIGDQINGISIEDYINPITEERYQIRTFTNYKFQDSVVNGKIQINLYSNSTTLLNKVEANLLFSTNDNTTTLKVKTHRNKIDNKISIDKYYVYDEKYNEHIEILDFDKQNSKLYVGSEGYVTLNPNSNNSSIYGGNNTELNIVFKQEEAIYETRYDFLEEPITYQSRIYSPRLGQGSIDVKLNGVNKEKLYYKPYQVSFFEPVKFYENNNQTYLLEDSFFSWHAKYILLNDNTDNIEIDIQWYVNGIKVETPIKYELPNIYNRDDIIKIIVTAKNGDMIIKREQLSVDVDFAPFSSPIYTQLDHTFDIVYRTDSLEFNLDILSHEYFNNIDIINSQFSWYIGSDYQYAKIINATEYNKKPTILADRYGLLFDKLYLKIYNGHEMKVVCFNLKLLYGDIGLDDGNMSDIIDSVNEANLSNNTDYITTKKVFSSDIDKNGLKDIIYASETDSGQFLNISYQMDSRVFVADKIEIVGNIFLGDFDGDSNDEVLVFGDLNSSIISLEKDNIHRVADVSITSNMNRLNIFKVWDMNGDSKDDLIIRNNLLNEIYLELNVFDMNQSILVGNATDCRTILDIRDINGDGYIDIICNPIDKLEYMYTEGTKDYFSSRMQIVYYIQTNSGQFMRHSDEYLTNIAPYQDILKINVFGSIMINDSDMAISVDDGTSLNIYIYTLNNNSKIPQSITKTNFSYYNFFHPRDINSDGFIDLMSFRSFGTGGQLNVLYQIDNTFTADYSTDILSSNQLINRGLDNVLFMDIDNDSKLEIVTVNGENLFSYINFKIIN